MKITILTNDGQIIKDLADLDVIMIEEDVKKQIETLDFDLLIVDLFQGGLHMIEETLKGLSNEYLKSVLMTHGDLEENSTIPTWRIPQSYQMKGEYREKSPAICSLYHEDTTRCDKNIRFTEKSCLENAGMGTIFIEHFIQEVAYKMGFTNKYGA